MHFETPKAKPQGVKMAKQPSNNIRVNVFIPAKTLKALRTLAARRGTSYSELVRTACRDYAVTELSKEKTKEL